MARTWIFLRHVRTQFTAAGFIGDATFNARLAKTRLRDIGRDIIGLGDIILLFA